MKRYDLHVHTEYSKCSNNNLKGIIGAAKKKRLDGIAITDHNLIEGALKLKNFNKDKNFEIIVGEEVYTNIGHVLVYFIKKKISPGKIENVLREAKKQNALVSLAHPYNNLPLGLSKISLVKNPRGSINTKDEKVLKAFDAIETFNSRVYLLSDNLRAKELAKKLNKPVTAGSDAHFISEIGNAYVEFDDKYSLREAILKKKLKIHGKRKSIVLNRIKSALCRAVKK